MKSIMEKSVMDTDYINNIKIATEIKLVVMCSVCGCRHDNEITINTAGTVEIYIAPCVNCTTISEMYEIIDTLENDNNSIPDWLWQKILDVRKRVEGRE